ncbi:MAG: hypothetical protein LBP76_00855 [Treponema sp.]|jgi:hypothetical protein|nr:hypothetical protein [Treponema sp.]
MKKICFVSVLCLAVMANLYAQSPDAFTWDLRLEKKTSGIPLDFNQTIEKLEVAVIPPDTPPDTANRSLARDEDFTIKVKPQANTYCYIIQYGPDRKVTLYYDAQINAGTEKAFEPVLTGSAGIDTFYIIMSSKRETKLENVIKAYRRSPNVRQVNSNVYYEALAIQKADEPLGEPPQRFTISGGTSRGTPANVPSDNPPSGTARYSGRGRYVRTISVKH